MLTLEDALAAQKSAQRVEKPTKPTRVAAVSAPQATISEADSDDEDDAASVGDSSPDTDEEETTFQFDDYDVDEAPAKGAYRIAVNDAADEFTSHHIRMRRRGALLWSSHWFFLNRKLKRTEGHRQIKADRGGSQHQ